MFLRVSESFRINLTSAIEIAKSKKELTFRFQELSIAIWACDEEILPGIRIGKISIQVDTSHPLFTDICEWVESLTFGSSEQKLPISNDVIEWATRKFEEEYYANVNSIPYQP